MVDFSERVDAASAEDISNYTIGGLNIIAAGLLDGSSSVRLTTSVMTVATPYVLTVNNVMDEKNNTIAANSQDNISPDSDYDGTFDTYIREASASSNYGPATTLQVDGDEPSGSATDMSVLLGWDIGTIPSDAVVQSAKIYLNVLNISSGPYFCYGLLTSWDEVQATWNNALDSSAWSVAGAMGAGDRDNLPLL